MVYGGGGGGFAFIWLKKHYCWTEAQFALYCWIFDFSFEAFAPGVHEIRAIVVLNRSILPNTISIPSVL